MKQAFDIGAAFTEGFQAWWKNLAPFVGLTLLIGLPFGLLFGLLVVVLGIDLGWVVDPEQAPQPQNEEELEAFLKTFLVGFSVILLFALIAYQLIILAVVIAADAAIAGRRWEVGEVIAKAVRHMPAALVVAILMSLGVVAGCAACVIPGVFLFVIWYVAVPALVLEKTGPIGAFSRSYQLVAPQFWYVLLLALGVFVINMAAGVIVGIAGLISPYLELAGNVVTNVFMTALAPVFQTVVFLHLRRHREGDPGDQIAEVFE